jgi:hypothetical protein
VGVQPGRESAAEPALGSWDAPISLRLDRRASLAMTADQQWAQTDLFDNQIE